nr:asparagine synthase C-terminal domain-containing protein [Alteromonas sp. 5E99-2]
MLKQSVTQSIGVDHSSVVSQMSGGMDSSSVTALAIEHQHNNSNKLISLSHFYSKSPESDESDLIKLLNNSLDCDDHILMAADNDQYSDFLSLYPTDFDSPGTVLSPRYHHEFQHCQHHNASLLLTGNGGDEMCWGHASAYTQRFMRGDISVIKEVFLGCKQTGIPFRAVAKKLFIKPLVPNYIMSLLGKQTRSETIDLPNWLTPQGQGLANASLTITSPYSQAENSVHFARHHTLKTTATFNSLRSYQKVGAQYGIKVAHPFFDKNIAQHSFDVSPKQLIRGAYPKWLLRSAMDKYLPKEVCWNTHKTTFDQHFTKLVRDNAVQLRNVLSHPKLADLGLLEPGPLLAQFDNVVQNKAGYVTVDLLYAILTQVWITQHHND